MWLSLLKDKIEISKVVFLVMLITVFAWNSTVLGQNEVNRQSNLIPVPTAEKFSKIWGTVQNAGHPQRDTTVKIYNEDGSLWYEFNYIWGKPLNLSTNWKEGFCPFAGSGDWDIRIRATGRSANWYEVVVNEKKKEIKYILIKSPNLVFSDWEEQFNDFILFDPQTNPLMDAPNGKEIPITIGEKEFFSPLRYVGKNPQGDWLQVQKLPKQGVAVKGWVRWRNGDDLLIWDGLRYLQKSIRKMRCNL